MDIASTGNADQDFTAGMILHHAGAIERAQVVLRDNSIRRRGSWRTASSLHSPKEIAEMRAWPAAHPE